KPHALGARGRSCRTRKRDAESRGESLNHYIESIAVQALVAEETARRLRLRRARGSAAKALAVLDRVLDRALPPGDTPRAPTAKRAPLGRTSRARAAMTCARCLARGGSSRAGRLPCGTRTGTFGRLLFRIGMGKRLLFRIRTGKKRLDVDRG